jgi:hypothetical protein
MLEAVIFLIKNAYIEELFKIVLFFPVLDGMATLLSLIGL